jgi:uncharacterized protein with PhoU and TrkA domain
MKKYKPVPVSKLLRKLQNISSLMLDLAYTSVIFADELTNLKKEVFKLESTVNALVTQLEVQTMLATRDVDDAYANISFLRIGQALHQIADAAADIASLNSISGIPLFKFVIEHSDERIVKAKISESTWPELFIMKITNIEEFFGFDIMAIARGPKIHFKFKKINLQTEDRLYIRGPMNSLQTFLKVVKGKLVDEKSIRNELNQYNENFDSHSSFQFNAEEKLLVQALIQLKNKSELSINLAFSAVLLNDQKLANEVMRLEKELDHLDKSLGLQALKLNSNTLEEQEKILTLIKFSKALEEISDAGLYIIQPFILDMERHPLLSDIVQEGDEKFSIYEVDNDSEAVDCSIGEFEKRVHGIFVVCLYRESNKGYLFDPSENYIIKSGDTLIIKAYGRQKKRLKIFEHPTV